MSLPISTMSQPRCRLGIVSDIRAKVIGSMPPTPMPMTKQVTRFIQYAGMVPQVDVATKMTAETRIEARRGYSDHRVSPTPTNSSTIPRSMYQVIAMPARWKCMSRAIQYMGNCNTTPVVVVRMPAQKPTGCSYDTPLARRPANAGHDRGLLPGESDEVTGCLLAWVGGATDAGERSGTMRSGTEAGRPRISTGSSTRPEEGMTAGINRTILGVPARRP